MQGSTRIPEFSAVFFPKIPNFSSCSPWKSFPNSCFFSIILDFIPSVSPLPALLQLGIFLLFQRNFSRDLGKFLNFLLTNSGSSPEIPPAWNIGNYPCWRRSTFPKKKKIWNKNRDKSWKTEINPEKLG